MTRILPVIVLLAALLPVGLAAQPTPKPRPAEAVLNEAMQMCVQLMDRASAAGIAAERRDWAVVLRERRGDGQITRLQHPLDLGRMTVELYESANVQACLMEIYGSGPRRDFVVRWAAASPLGLRQAPGPQRLVDRSGPLEALHWNNDRFLVTYALRREGPEAPVDLIAFRRNDIMPRSWLNSSGTPPTIVERARAGLPLPPARGGNR